ARADETKLNTEIEGTLPGLQARVGELQQSLTAAESQLPADFLAPYRRLAQAYGAGALAEVEGNICGSCDVALPPQWAAQVRAGQVVFCKTCGRLLYGPRE